MCEYVYIFIHTHKSFHKSGRKAKDKQYEESFERGAQSRIKKIEVFVGFFLTVRNPDFTVRQKIKIQIQNLVRLNLN